MLQVIRHAVSENRKRYIDTENGFDLDLSYITDQVIAMGFPSQSLEGYYRNPINEVRRFLDMKHLGHYKLYNLCSERTYEDGCFGTAPVARYPFDDHCPPPFEILTPFCRDVADWLAADPGNMAAIHCKAGKGRTGLCTCVFLIYSGVVGTTEEALQYYSGKRTWDGEGVTIPSQIRYIRYFEQLMSAGNYQPEKLAFTKVIIHTIPKPFNSYEVAFSIYHNGLKIYSAKRADCFIERQPEKIIIKMAGRPTAIGDIKIVFGYYDLWGKHSLCHFWLNTGFIKPSSEPPSAYRTPTRTIVLEKFEIDRACKDKYNEEFKEGFKVEVVVENVEEFDGS